MRKCLASRCWIWVTILLICAFNEEVEAASSVYRMAQGGQQGLEGRISGNGDVGRISNCPDNKGNFSLMLEWSPRIIRYQQSYRITTDITLAEPLDSFYECSQVWIQGMEEPLYDYCQWTTCLNAVDRFKGFIRDLPCPIPAGKNFKTTLSDTVDQRIAIVTGDFIVRYQAKNAQGKEILCLQGLVSSREYD